VAARVLGISQEQVLEKFGRGELQAVRVRRRRTTAWRFRVDGGGKDPEPSLFEGPDIRGDAL
jgi:hypothetical protein